MLLRTVSVSYFFAATVKYEANLLIFTADVRGD